jgi:hypothetical protein
LEFPNIPLNADLFGTAGLLGYGNPPPPSYVGADGFISNLLYIYLADVSQIMGFWGFGVLGF